MAPHASSARPETTRFLSDCENLGIIATVRETASSKARPVYNKARGLTLTPRGANVLFSRSGHRVYMPILFVALRESYTNWSALLHENILRPSMGDVSYVRNNLDFARYELENIVLTNTKEEANPTYPLSCWILAFLPQIYCMI